MNWNKFKTNVGSLLLMGLAMIVTTSRLQAEPAHPQPFTVTQPDGSSLTLKLVGDEFYHYNTTIDGYTVTPVAYLGSQVVAGTNYAFLCQGKFDDDAKLSYIMLYVTQDTEGNVEILDIADFDIGEYCGY